MDCLQRRKLCYSHHKKKAALPNGVQPYAFHTVGNTGFPSPIINLLDVYNHIFIFTADTQANT